MNTLEESRTFRLGLARTEMTGIDSDINAARYRILAVETRVQDGVPFTIQVGFRLTTARTGTQKKILTRTFRIAATVVQRFVNSLHKKA